MFRGPEPVFFRKSTACSQSDNPAESSASSVGVLAEEVLDLGSKIIKCSSQSSEAQFPDSLLLGSLEDYIVPLSPMDCDSKGCPSKLFKSGPEADPVSTSVSVSSRP